MVTTVPLYDKDAVDKARSGRQQWEHTELSAAINATPETRDGFRTISGIPIERLYTPEHVESIDYERDLGNPGQFPFTRGVYPTMYRGRLWTRRQIAGFGTAKSTNSRYKFLLANGQTGLSTDFDHPTLTGYDSLHPLAEGEVGRLGVAIDTLPDMADLFDGIPLDEVSISLTINHPAMVLLAFLLAHAESQGTPWKRLRGTVQNDSLKEFHGQKTFALPPRGAFRMTMDVVEFCTKRVPAWNTISISGYHTREAGSNAVQELAFTLAQGMAYVEGGLRRGMRVDAFGPRLSFFFGVHMDFFEEVAKLRAARRLWARLMKERYGATDPKAMVCRFHSQTLGSTLIRNGVLNNIVRGSTQALAAVLGGTQSLHVSGYDEAHDIPSEDAMRISLATQRIIGSETGVASTSDPLGGSFYVERLTNEIEEQALAYIGTIEDMGGGSMLDGMFAAIDAGYIEREIAEAAYDYQRCIEDKDYMVLGLNEPAVDASPPPELYEHDESEEAQQIERLSEVVRQRDPAKAVRCLDALRAAAEGDANLMPFVLDAARGHATEGEIMGVLRDVFGEYRDPAVF
jgi:methylmalonyl-CoA mutase N-terminal domain/subunit